MGRSVAIFLSIYLWCIYGGVIAPLAAGRPPDPVSELPPLLVSLRSMAPSVATCGPRATPPMMTGAGWGASHGGAHTF